MRFISTTRCTASSHVLYSTYIVRAIPRLPHIARRTCSHHHHHHHHHHHRCCSQRSDPVHSRRRLQREKRTTSFLARISSWRAWGVACVSSCFCSSTNVCTHAAAQTFPTRNIHTENLVSKHRRSGLVDWSQVAGAAGNVCYNPTLAGTFGTQPAAVPSRRAACFFVLRLCGDRPVRPSCLSITPGEASNPTQPNPVSAVLLCTAEV